MYLIIDTYFFNSFNYILCFMCVLRENEESERELFFLHIKKMNENKDIKSIKLLYLQIFAKDKNKWLSINLFTC